MYDPELDVELITPGMCEGCGAKLPASRVKKNIAYCLKCVRGAYATPVDDGKDLQNLARQELAKRELARRRLIPFAQQIKPDYHVGWFQKDLAARLERFLRRVIEKKSPRMIINVQPRIGKTELSSRIFPAWALGRYPWLHFIAATHSDYLAFDNSRDVIGYINHERYGQIFPDTRLDPAARGAAGWRIAEHGGRYKPAGAGKGISGYGAHVFIIDDPHKDKEAFSETVLDSIARWYKSSVRTRLAPGGGIILIQTRWVLNDLTGRVIEEEGLIEDGGLWEQVLYPAEATHDEYRLPSGLIVPTPREGATLLRKKGETVDPERWPPELLAEPKRDPMVWAALYQQNPVAGDAAMFKEEWFPECYMKDIPERGTKYVAWDTAVQTKETSSYTVGLVGKYDGEKLWIIDMIRDRLDGYGIVDAILTTYAEHREQETGIERTNHAVATQPFLEQEAERRRLASISIRLIDHGGKDKAMRARPIQAMARIGRVMVPRDAPWYDDFMAEIKTFPVGLTKDIGDAFAHLGQMITDMHTPAESAAKPKESWRDKVRVRGTKRDWRAG